MTFENILLFVVYGIIGVAYALVLGVIGFEVLCLMSDRVRDFRESLK